MITGRQILKAEANSILFLQNYLDEDNLWISRISKYSDFSYSISILFPVFASLDTKLGYQVLLATSTTEWATTLLKWALAENRPYWWIREAASSGDALPPLRQTDITCETGPGSASSHVAGTAALLYVLVSWLLNWLGAKGAIRLLLWLLYVALVTTVGIARVTVAAHFPHQCVLGAVVGFLLTSRLIDGKFWTWIRSATRWKTTSLALATCAISVGAFFAHKAIGDPGWSIKLAFKWCHQPTSAVSVQTTPIYALVRDAGAIFGLSVGSPLVERRFYPVVGAFVTSLFFVGTRLLRPMMPTNDALQFYTFHFLDHVFVSVAMLTIVPYLAALVRIKQKRG
ncbi:Hypothetical protein NTJ_09492 [Nesidiocoris tenuis]|uniref:Glucose-6-phosphatase n=1 Tax=Nesidiocoris tenuis TaxID=355587 RepID=A0ABN7AYP7_9HEMI|nr:Hypothetical protein NTJ_09492 [Nesidiocoris tenuis]